MGKVSIGLRGWRFDESDVFDENGEFLPLEAMPKDARTRVLRLSGLVGTPCDACWLVHGDENIEQCNVVNVVYGEPLSEVVLCDEHEAAFLYWYREAGGDQYRGEDELQDAFHEWFADGGRAPDGYAGLDHVDTDPESIPDPPEPDMDMFTVELPEEQQERIDLRDVDDSSKGEEIDLEDVDLSTDYPS